jgi:hypothetical protein
MTLEVGATYVLRNGDVVVITKIEQDSNYFPINGKYVDKNRPGPKYSHFITWTREGKFCSMPNQNQDRDIVGLAEDWGTLVELDKEAV